MQIFAEPGYYSSTKHLTNVAFFPEHNCSTDLCRLHYSNAYTVQQDRKIARNEKKRRRTKEQQRERVSQYGGRIKSGRCQRQRDQQQPAKTGMGGVEKLVELFVADMCRQKQLPESNVKIRPVEDTCSVKRCRNKSTCKLCNFHQHVYKYA